MRKVSHLKSWFSNILAVVLYRFLYANADLECKEWSFRKNSCLTPEFLIKILLSCLSCIRIFSGSQKQPHNQAPIVKMIWNAKVFLAGNTQQLLAASFSHALDTDNSRLIEYSTSSPSSALPKCRIFSLSKFAELRSREISNVEPISDYRQTVLSSADLRHRWQMSPLGELTADRFMNVGEGGAIPYDFPLCVPLLMQLFAF